MDCSAMAISKNPILMESKVPKICRRMRSPRRMFSSSSWSRRQSCKLQLSKGLELSSSWKRERPIPAMGSKAVNSLSSRRIPSRIKSITTVTKTARLEMGQSRNCPASPPRRKSRKMLSPNPKPKTKTKRKIINLLKHFTALSASGMYLANPEYQRQPKNSTVLKSQSPTTSR